MGDVVQMRPRTRELRGFISIQSNEEPDPYVSVRLSVGNDPQRAERLEFSSGDFITDWDTAISRFIEIALEQNFDQVNLARCCCVDMWEHDSCQYIEIEPDGKTEFFTSWRRCTPEEERVAREMLAELRAE